jgi:uncharacterized membrane protein
MALTTAIAIVRWLHIVAGVVALTTFTVPILVAKGSRLHRRFGWAYVVAMIVASVASWVIAPLRMLERPADRWPSSIFLAYVGLMSFTAAVYGVRILRQKTRAAPHPLGLDYVPALLLAAATPAMIGYSVLADFTLGVLFPALGFLVAIPQLQTLRATPSTRRFWLAGHIGAMLIACIATLTAFLVVNASRYVDGAMLTVAWFLPTIVLTPLMVRWQRKPPRIIG